MKRLQLLPIGKLTDGLLPFLQRALEQSFQVDCDIIPTVLDPSPMFHSQRRQYHSSELLSAMQKLVSGECWRLLGVTDNDLYIPILTFVFGEAQMDGQCALVSTRRLRQEFYGLAPNEDLLENRLLKEAVHEIGHTCGLTHCDNYLCAMAASHAVEWIDLKEASLCPDCRKELMLSVPRTIRGEHRGRAEKTR